MTEFSEAPPELKDPASGIGKRVAAEELNEFYKKYPRYRPVPGISNESTQAPARGAAVFISYRRNDERWFAARLAAHLANRYGEHNIFFDVDNIRAGDDFHLQINRALAASDVLLAVIGQNWLESDMDGRSRLNEDYDVVKYEIVSARERQLDIIPVLVERASMPRTEQVPRCLSWFLDLSGMNIHHASFTSDANRLIGEIERIRRDRRLSP